MATLFSFSNRIEIELQVIFEENKNLNQKSKAAKRRLGISIWYLL
jgi:hypothetical protein